MNDVLKKIGISELNSGVSYKLGEWVSAQGKQTIKSLNPANQQVLASVSLATEQDYEQAVQSLQQSFQVWRMVPAPERGELVRKIGLKLRENKEVLGKLVTLECGKIIQEGLGEVQEMIDIADYAVGLSRSLSGPTLQSERRQHRILEQWLPIGPVGVVTAFNFPVAVWAWNAMIALVCGDTVLWNPSSQTPLTAIATHRIVSEVITEQGYPDIIALMVGAGSLVGNKMSDDIRIPMVSVTGSIPTGKKVAQRVAARLGRTILELGGNNAAIVMEDADLEIARRAIFFGAVGTAGQRCTTTRRIFLHEKIYDQFMDKLIRAYQQWTVIGDPLDEKTTCGPLINQGAVDQYLHALDKIKTQNGKIIQGGKVVDGPGFYVEPTIVEIEKGAPITKEETFVPILYVMKVSSVEEALQYHNDVPQGLSSAIITNNLRYSEKFLSAQGSDCGIANVNTSTSGAEIGGAFGGEKETGGGRESGSDAWKGYMRRQTVSINYGEELPLAQGIEFIKD